MSSLLGVGPVVAPVQETHVAHHWVGFNVEVQISINGNVQSVYSCIVTVSHFHETLGQFSAVIIYTIHVYHLCMYQLCMESGLMDVLA